VGLWRVHNKGAQSFPRAIKLLAVLVNSNIKICETTNPAVPEGTRIDFQPTQHSAFGCVLG
jgi:hypothetical protein